MARPLTSQKIILPRGILIGLLLIFLLRLWLAIKLPLAFDEAYYWLWSQHLAGGYYDHPPMVALVIRLGTMLFGDTGFGVRAVSLLLAVPATWAVWRSAAILFKNEDLAARAALYFNLTLLVSGGTVIVTPDAPLLLAAAMTLYFLTRLWETGNYQWWLATGAAVGFGLVSKYTAFFMGFSILLWLVVVPQMRRWLYTPWPYLAGILALAIFSPVIMWNWHHDNASFAKQFGRVAVHGFTLRHVPQFIMVQFGLLTPPVFILGMIGLWKFVRGEERCSAERALISTTILPLVIYFFWHALHDKVEGNWLMPIFPAFAIMASWEASIPHLARFSRLSRQSAAPVGIAVLLLVAMHTMYFAFPNGTRDYASKKLAFGWDALAPQIDALRLKSRAGAILTSSYATTSWLSFYLPAHSVVIQVNEPVRWVNFDLPDPAALPAPLLYVTDVDHDLAKAFPIRGKRLALLASLPRLAHGQEVEQLRVYRIR